MAMSDKEYEEIYTDFIARRKEGMTVREVQKLYSKVFDGYKPIYNKLGRIEFQMLLTDLYCMYIEGHSDGIEDGLREVRKAI